MHHALECCGARVTRYQYVLKEDIGPFFPSVDHERLYDAARAPHPVRSGPVPHAEHELASGAEALSVELMPADKR